MTKFCCSIPGEGEGRSFKAGFLGASSRIDSSLIPPGEAITVGVGPHSELSKIVLQYICTKLTMSSVSVKVATFMHHTPLSFDTQQDPRERLYMRVDALQLRQGKEKCNSLHHIISIILVCIYPDQTLNMYSPTVITAYVYYTYRSSFPLSEMICGATVTLGWQV